jgi:hypothetical protein
MNMPGFTAATSLYKTDRYNQVVRNYLDTNGSIHPAGLQDPNCVSDCADSCIDLPTNQQRRNCFNRCVRRCPILVFETI